MPVISQLLNGVLPYSGRICRCRPAASRGARTLSAYCRPGSLLPIDQVVQIVYKVAKALHYAHSNGKVDTKASQIKGINKLTGPLGNAWG